MKKNLLSIAVMSLLTGLLIFALIKNNQTLEHQEQASKRNAEFEKAAFSPLRAKYMYDMEKDPVTGKIPEGAFKKAYEQTKLAPEKSSARTEANNSYLIGGNLTTGGRTRAFAIDKRFNGTSNRVMLAGGVSGGLFRSTDGGANWTKVNASDQIHNVHCIVQDTSTVANYNIWYAAGGEHWGNSAEENGAAYMGDGLWKSTDNGATWTKTSMTYTQGASTVSGPFFLERFDHPFDYVHKIAVNPTNGHVYVGCHRRLMRSTDGGSTWQVVLVGNAAGIASNGTIDVAVTSTGRVIAAVNGGNEDNTLRGVWTSNTGNVGSFTRIAGGSTLGVDSVDGWRGNSYDVLSGTTNVPKRIVLALAPSNNNIMYLAFENGEAGFDNDVDLYRVDLATNTWSNRTSGIFDFGGQVGTFDTQGGYDLCIAIKPNDPNFVILGGVNLLRSTNGFQNFVATDWIGGYGDPNLNPFLYPNHHPDQHAVTFRPDNPNICYSAHDGGVSVSTNITNSTVSWSYVENYQTFQYYYVTIDPGAGRNNFMGGLQDNGTWMRDRAGILGTAVNDSNRHVFLFPAFSGDGGSVGIAAHSGGQQFVYASSQLGTIRRALLPNFSSSTLIRPNGATANPNGGFGEFITVFKLNPSNTEDLYYVNFGRLFRTTSASTVTPSSGWTELTGISAAVDPTVNPNTGRYIRAIAFSWGPYQNTHAMYIGTTDSRIFRFDNPRNSLAGAAPVNISIPGLPAGANIQDIAVNPNDDNEIMAVVSNYEVSNANVVSVWWTNNAKSASPTWRNAEGNLLTSVSARSCAIVVKRDAGNNPVTEYYVGTSVGLFSAVNIGPTLIGAGSVSWFREGSSVMGMPVVQSLSYRPVDNVLLVGTHGNGMYFTYLGTPNYTPNTPTPVSNVVMNDKNFISAVFPTVSNGKVDFRIGNMYNTKRITVQLFSANGSLVYNKASGYQNGAVDLSELSRGTYVLSITSDDGKYKHLQKIIRN